MKVVIYSFGLFLFANLLDILSSIGAPEANPLMRGDHGIFMLSHALVVKTAYLFIMAVVGWMGYELGNLWNKRVGFFLCALVPLYDSYELLHVFFHNIFARIGWYNFFGL